MLLVPHVRIPTAATLVAAAGVLALLGGVMTFIVAPGLCGLGVALLRR